ncbi:MAG: hypothetical protein ACO1SX_14765, partial [Actinomycetota bacterium]
MWLTICRFVTLLVVGLGLAMGAAHVLELPQKMQFSPELYAAVNAKMYRYFGLAGAVLTVGGIVSSVILMWMVRDRPSFPLTAAGTICLAVSLVLWLTLVAPVNNHIAELLRLSPDTVPDVWMRLRDRWEYGHVLVFLSWLLGYCYLQ